MGGSGSWSERATVKPSASSYPWTRKGDARWPIAMMHAWPSSLVSLVVMMSGSCFGIWCRGLQELIDAELSDLRVDLG
jgi:hypothetical protein